MDKEPQSISFLMADDDPEDQIILREAFRKARLLNRMDCVGDGVELLAYLRRHGKYAGAPRPDIILLDLNMPRKGGLDALAEIRADPALKTIPVVVLTCSDAEEDILRTYQLGVNSYIRKPVNFESLVDVVRKLGSYWLEIVELPKA